MKKITTAALALAAALTLTACDDADVVSHNLSKDADNFKVDRRVVFVNGITDEYLLSIEGKCSLFDDGNQLEVTCKTAEGQHKKHFLGLSDNVTYFAEQIAPSDVSEYHYKVVLKPSVIVPDVDVDVDL